MHRKSAFAMAVSWIVTAYLVIATFVFHHTARTAADRAAVWLLAILTGAVGIVAFCLLIRWAEEDGTTLPVGDRSLDEQGEIDPD